MRLKRRGKAVVSCRPAAAAENYVAAASAVVGRVGVAVVAELTTIFGRHAVGAVDAVGIAAADEAVVDLAAAGCVFGRP